MNTSPSTPELLVSYVNLPSSPNDSDREMESPPVSCRKRILASEDTEPCEALPKRVRAYPCPPSLKIPALVDTLPFEFGDNSTGGVSPLRLRASASSGVDSPAANVIDLTQLDDNSPIVTFVDLSRSVDESDGPQGDVGADASITLLIGGEPVVCYPLDNSQDEQIDFYTSDTDSDSESD